MATLSFAPKSVLTISSVDPRLHLPRIGILTGIVSMREFPQFAIARFRKGHTNHFDWIHRVSGEVLLERHQGTLMEQNLHGWIVALRNLASC